MSYTFVFIIIGILLGLSTSAIALKVFRKNIIKNTKPCCAKCMNCKGTYDCFTCKKTNKKISNLLISGTDCCYYQEE